MRPSYRCCVPTRTSALSKTSEVLCAAVLKRSALTAHSSMFIDLVWMGQGKRVLKRDFKGPREEGWGKKSNDDGYQEFQLENADFEAYYKAQVSHCDAFRLRASLRRTGRAVMGHDGCGLHW